VAEPEVLQGNTENLARTRFWAESPDNWPKPTAAAEQLAALFRMLEVPDRKRLPEGQNDGTVRR
jgi:hypothetical protein